MLLSIDDYYLSKKNRYQLASQVHPLLLTRGVPGTHDIKKLKEHIKQFNKKHIEKKRDKNINITKEFSKLNKLYKAQICKHLLTM